MEPLMHKILIVDCWWIWFQMWAGVFTSIRDFWRLFQRKTTSRKEMNDNREWKFSLPSSSSFSQSGLPTPKGPFWARNVTTHTLTHKEGSQRRCEDSRRLRSHRTERWVSPGDAASTAPGSTRWPRWADAMWWARTTRLPGTTTKPHVRMQAGLCRITRWAVTRELTPRSSCWHDSLARQH